ncbi:MAG TPA: YggS family pyridoxal phosphate-dependent enzyme [Rhodothermales bacterium]
MTTASLSTISDRVQSIRERIAAAAERVGRDPGEITLVAISKTFPAEVVAEAHSAGVVDFGENRVQELAAKADALADTSGMRWHMVGHLQRNKAKEVVRLAHLFHALDSARLARELNARAEQAGRVLPCLVQVNTSGEETKEGVGPEAVAALLDELATFPAIAVSGFMTVAAPADNPEQVRHEFRRLRGIRDRQRLAHPEMPLSFLSMGMSGDFEVAIEEGATHVRLGRILFGERD